MQTIQLTTLSEEQQILTYLDKLFPFFPMYGEFNVMDLVHQSNWVGSEKDRAFQLSEKIEIYLCKRLKYAEGDSLLSLTDKGRAVQGTGGHVAYAEKVKRLAEHREEKEFTDLKMATKVYKTYGSVRFMATCAFAVSMVFLFVKLAELLKLWP
jgi:hypothetical protein